MTEETYYLRCQIISIGLAASLVSLSDDPTLPHYPIEVKRDKVWIDAQFLGPGEITGYLTVVLKEDDGNTATIALPIANPQISWSTGELEVEKTIWVTSQLLLTSIPNRLQPVN